MQPESDPELRPAGGRAAARSMSGLLWLLLIRLVLGLAYSAAIPLGEAPDEADHLAYAAYIATEHRLPEGTWMTQAKHPPLYHVLAAGVAGWAGMDTGFLRANPDSGFTPDASPNFFIHTTLEAWPWRDGPLAMHLARLVSVLAGVGLVAAAYALGRVIWPGWRAGALAAAAFVAFLPESLFVGGAMSNDILAALLATLALWMALWSRKPRHALLAGVIMGLGLWAKVSVAALWPVVCLAMLAQGRRQGRSWASALVLPLIAGLVALLVTAPWFLRNRQLYGDWMGWPLVLATIDRRTGPFGLAELAWLVRGQFVSFWGSSAALAISRFPCHSTRSGLCSRRPGCSAGCDVALPRPLRAAATGLTLPSALVLLGAPLLTTAWLVSYSRVALGTDQGRLLFPAVGPLALLLIGGLGQWVPRVCNPRSWPLMGWCGLMVTMAVLALVTGIVIPFGAPAAPTAAEMASASLVGQVFGDQLELVGYRWEASSGDVNRERSLSLYWRAVKPPETDLRASLRLLDDRGAVIWEWKRSPGAGRFSTDRWPTGRVVADAYSVPVEQLVRAVRVEIGLRPFPEEAWLKLRDGTSSLLLAKPGQ